MPVLKWYDGADWVETEAAAPAHSHDADYEPDGAVATHSADTTSVHGITDTSALALTSHDHDADYVQGTVKLTVASSAPGSPATNDVWIDIS